MTDKTSPPPVSGGIKSSVRKLTPKEPTPEGVLWKYSHSAGGQACHAFPQKGKDFRMGKRSHGRLVHEVRDALYRAGFMPTRLTQLDAPSGLSAVRSPGFKVEKHNDGKSVRLSHVTASAATGPADARAKLFLSLARARSQADYAAALEREGFTRVEADGREGSGPFSLWRLAGGEPTGREVN